MKEGMAIISYIVTGLGFFWGVLQLLKNDKSKGIDRDEILTIAQCLIISIVGSLFVVYYTDAMLLLAEKLIGFSVPFPALLGFLIGVFSEKLGRFLAKYSIQKKK